MESTLSKSISKKCKLYMVPRQESRVQIEEKIFLIFVEVAAQAKIQKRGTCCLQSHMPLPIVQRRGLSAFWEGEEKLRYRSDQQNNFSSALIFFKYFVLRGLHMTPGYIQIKIENRGLKDLLIYKEKRMTVRGNQRFSRRQIKMRNQGQL